MEYETTARHVRVTSRQTRKITPLPNKSRHHAFGWGATLPFLGRRSRARHNLDPLVNHFASFYLDSQRIALELKRYRHCAVLSNNVDHRVLDLVRILLAVDGERSIRADLDLGAVVFAHPMPDERILRFLFFLRGNRVCKCC